MRSTPSWLRAVLAVIVIVVFSVVIVVVFHRNGNNGQSTATSPSSTPVRTPTNPAPSTSKPPTPVVAACPQAKRLPGTENNFKNRVFDYEEARLISDPLTQIAALEQRGDPKGLVSQQLLKRMKAEAARASKGDTSVTIILDRAQSTFDMDEESTNTTKIAYVIPVYTTCRDGKVVNDPIADTEPRMSVWSKDGNRDGAWRVIE